MMDKIVKRWCGWLWWKCERPVVCWGGGRLIYCRDSVTCNRWRYVRLFTYSVGVFISLFRSFTQSLAGALFVVFFHWSTLLVKTALFISLFHWSRPLVNTPMTIGSCVSSSPMAPQSPAPTVPLKAQGCVYTKLYPIPMQSYIPIPALTAIPLLSTRPEQTCCPAKTNQKARFCMKGLLDEQIYWCTQKLLLPRTNKALIKDIHTPPSFWIHVTSETTQSSPSLTNNTNDKHNQHTYQGTQWATSQEILSPNI